MSNTTQGGDSVYVAVTGGFLEQYRRDSFLDGNLHEVTFSFSYFGLLKRLFLEGLTLEDLTFNKIVLEVFRLNAL